MIEFNATLISDIPNKKYLEYPSYKVKLVDYDYIDKSGFYYFFLSYCYNQNATVEIEYMVLNPGNEHLSFDLIPNKRTYLMFFIIWATVFFISIV